jgi:hypothetical protein
MTRFIGLIRDEDTWLIDDLEVVNEKIKPQGIEIKN